MSLLKGRSTVEKTWEFIVFSLIAKRIRISSQENVGIHVCSEGSEHRSENVVIHCVCIDFRKSGFHFWSETLEFMYSLKGRRTVQKTWKCIVFSLISKEGKSMFRASPKPWNFMSFLNTNGSQTMSTLCHLKQPRSETQVVASWFTPN